jgi:hypothetical protein
MFRLIVEFLQKWLWKLVVVWVVAWAMIWVVASLAAPVVVKTVMPKVQAKARSLGVRLNGVSYESIRVSPWLNAVTAKKVSASFDLAPNDPYQFSSSFQCKELRVQLRQPLSLRGSVTVRHFDVRFHDADLPKGFPFDRFFDGDVIWLISRC